MLEIILVQGFCPLTINNDYSISWCIIGLITILVQQTSVQDTKFSRSNHYSMLNLSY